MTRKQKTVSKIIELKEADTERLEAEARKASERLDREQEKLDSLDRDHRKTSMDLLAKQSQGTLPVNDLDLFTTYLNHLEKQIAVQRSIVNLRAAELEKVQKAMLVVHTEQRLLERLGDKLEREQTKSAGKAAQKESDFGFLTRREGR